MPSLLACAKMMIRQQSFVAAVLLVLPLHAFLTFQQFTHQIGLRSTFADEDAHLLPRGNVTASVVVKVSSCCWLCCWFPPPASAVIGHVTKHDSAVA